MTEQEKRDLEIAELEKSLPHFISNDTRRWIAVKLRDKGYRKEEEVQNELFHKIYHKIEDYMTCCISRCEEINAIEVDKILRDCGRELGLDVEE